MGCCLSIFSSRKQLRLPIPSQVYSAKSSQKTNEIKKTIRETSNEVYARFQLFSKIGAGRIAKTYRAVDEQGKRVALKVIPKAQLQTDEVLENILNSNKALANLQHQNLMSLYEVIETSTDVFLVLEYAEKGSFERIIKSFPTLPKAVYKSLIAQILIALYFLQSHGITYGEISMKNIFIDGHGVVKLAEMHELSGASFFDQNMDGGLSYIAPEIFKGTPPSILTDIFSLGVLVYYCLHRRFPMFSKNKLVQSFDDEELDEQTREVAALVRKMLEVNPKKRIGKSLKDFYSVPLFRGFDWNNPKNDKTYHLWVASIRTLRDPEQVGTNSNELPTTWNPNRSGIGPQKDWIVDGELTKDILSADIDYDTGDASSSRNGRNTDKLKSRHRLSWNQ